MRSCVRRNHSVTPISFPTNSFSACGFFKSSGIESLPIAIPRPSSAIARPRQNLASSRRPSRFATLRQLPLRDRFNVHFVRSVRQSQSPHHRPRARQKSILRNSRSSVRLYRAIKHAQRHVGRHYFNHRNLRARRLVPRRIHHLRRLERQQPRLLDLHARFRNPRANRSLLGQRFPERHSTLHALAHHFQRPLRHSNAAHALMAPPRPQPPLRNFKSAPFAQQHIRHWHTHIFEMYFGVPVRRMVVTKHPQHPHDFHSRRIQRHQNHGLLFVRRSRRIALG